MKNDNSNSDQNSQTRQSDWESELSQKATAALNEKLAALDAHTLQRINQVRQQVLEKSSRPRWSQWLVPMASLATILASVAVVITLTSQQPDSIEIAMPDDTTLEILMAEDDLELYQDLDFYLWLDQQDGQA